LRRLTIIGLLLVLVGLLGGAQFFCPPQGCALPGAWAFNRLKNRTVLPRAADFDDHATLAALLRPGDDRARWTETRAAVIEGYVVAVAEAGSEGANCFSPTRRDTHIEVALQPDAPARARMVVEVTPRLRDMARAQGLDWTTAALSRDLTGHWCRFEGWLLFDDRHAGEAENTMPGRAGNWRATGWELHPVTALKIIR
jgi:hypothetical protein